MRFALKYALLIIGLGSILLSGYSQPNLVLNHSFEQYDSCTSFVGNIFVSKNWVSGSLLTPDYFNVCNTFPVSSPSNFIGFQHVQDGGSYSGIAMSRPNDLREAIQGKLQQPLEAGKYYCVEMYISIADSMYYNVNEINISLYQDSILASDYMDNHNNLPYQVSMNTVGAADTSDWHLISGGFVASGGENFFLIGFFSSNLTWTKFRPSNLDDQVTYYYIDNISIYECTPPAVIIPDVFTPNGDGINDIFYIAYLPEGSVLKIYNRWGNIVYENRSYHNDWDGSTGAGQKVSDGTYFYALQTPDGKKYSSTVNVFK